MGTITPDSNIISNIFSGEHINEVISWLSWAGQFLYAIVVLIAITILIINIAKLSRSSGNPTERAKALFNIFVSGGCIAALGGIGLIFLILVSWI